ncbi:hydrogen peroxide-inducible protein [Mycolicibacterium phlei DSM 43070]|uniref:hydrogen peroxide-inducible genes activator n=1 Tax=Mycolicibacterium phlei TaxID=1771 RepID=UPI0007771D3F|nr:hydrogen peroxide-inducible genes activator [Mycolicibacterium phlei]KXW74467.1 hydrogen peroxide-inducible protein [Mycolicibacterium phlei DSM 43070]
MASTPSVAQLRAFVAVSRLQHFGAAATQLGISQPTLSQLLSKLEANLGLQLIERTSRRVLVTPAGQRLLPHGEAAVEAVHAIVDAAEPAGWLFGALRVGIIPTIAPYLLPTLLGTLHDEAPDLRLVVREEQTHRLLDALRRDEIDVALLALPISEPGLVAQPVYEEDFVLAVSADSELAGATDVPIEALRRQPLLLLDEGHCLRDQALEVCALANVQDTGHDAARASSLPTVVQLVAAGMGATLLPATAVPVETRGAALGIATFADPAPGRRVGIVWRAASSRGERFLDLARVIRRAVVDGGLPARSVVGVDSLAG